MMSVTTSHARRRIAAALTLIILSAPIVFTSCQQKTDWNKFDSETVRASLDVLATAGSDFVAEQSINGLASAVAKTKAGLEANDAVQEVAVSSDSSITALFKNGLVGCVLNAKDGTHGSASAPDRVRAASGGETPSPYFVLSPFHTEFGSNDPSGYIADKLREFLDPTSATQVYEYYDATATVDVVRTAVISSVLYWAGHGGFVSVGSGTIDAPGLLTGEGGTPEAVAQRVMELEGQGYQFKESGGWELFTIAFHDRVWIGILPAFVTNYGDFDRFEWMPVARTKSIAYISCCNSWKFRDVFKAKGVDAFLGWSASVSEEFSNNQDADFFCALCDTFTVKEAYDNLGSHTEPGGATLYWQGDGDVMLRSAARYKVDGRDVKCYLLTCAVDDGTVLGCNDGLGEVGVIEVIWPGGTGTFDVTTTEDVTLVWAGIGSPTPYIAQKDYKGVSGTIKIDRYDDGVISGTFSGTLGQWPIGADPEEEPPSATVTIADGYFKYSGKRTGTK